MTAWKDRSIPAEMAILAAHELTATDAGSVCACGDFLSSDPPEDTMGSGEFARHIGSQVIAAKTIVLSIAMRAIRR